MKLKLYIYDEIECGHHNGLAFAIAATEDEAKGLILAKIEQYNETPVIWGDVTIRSISNYGAYCCG